MSQCLSSVTLELASLSISSVVSGLVRDQRYLLPSRVDQHLKDQCLRVCQGSIPFLCPQATRRLSFLGSLMLW